MKKLGRNDKCGCGSGKKYKYCCLKSDVPTMTNSSKSSKSLYDKIVEGEIPFTSRIISKEEEPFSMVISKASVTINGITKTLIDEEITLSTNTVSGDKTEESATLISIPTSDSSKGTIKTFGNAQVLNGQEYLDIEINTSNNKMSLRSPNGLFASLKITKQRDSGFNFLTILFGVKNNTEFVNEEGRKNRSDIAIYPNGNGKFIRLSDKNGDFDSTWEISNEITYETDKKVMYPSTITLSSKIHTEKLILNFNYQNGKVQLINGNFE
ncbi:YecA family protein [Flavobacterium restrictum]|uniref:YecA family protein n=1 Tax=Flavobacterium restrictum TaxID=2594428 RepID=UPI001C8F620F|nr:SEC-C domain-containing protein [Flavobacterium restrictum]